MADPENLQQDIKKLIEDIQEYRVVEEENTNVHNILKNVQSYSNDYIEMCSQFHTIPENLVVKKSNKASEIVSLLCMLETYLLDITRKEVPNGTDLYKAVRTLNSKKETFTKDKSVWMTVIRNLSTQLDSINTCNKLKLRKD